MEPKTYCWICNKIADSAEHRVKKSDLISLHGPGPYKEENALFLVREGNQTPIQGPKSRVVKYKKNLCSTCNNSFSQPFDKAYECFVNYVLQNENLLLSRRFIDFKDVYGEDFENCQRNLYKYFVKSFGCRLANDNYPIPEDLPKLLSQRRFRTRLRITFSVDEDLLSPDWDNVLGNGHLCTLLPTIETRPTWIEKWRARRYGRTRPLEYLCSENFKWLHTWCWYDMPPDGKLGSTWVANSQYIYLGSHQGLFGAETGQWLENLCVL